MKVLPSTWMIGSFGLALTVAGVGMLKYGDPKSTFDWLPWAFISLMTGVVLMLGAIARQAILSSPAGAHQKAISTGLAGGLGVGGLGGGEGGDGGGDGG